MILFKEARALKAHLSDKKAQDIRIGFVPTMGALHQGHISLIEQAKANSDYVVASIFVNPTQFNNTADLLNYPKTIDKDISMLLEAGCDALYHPEVSDLYQANEPKLSAADYGTFIHVLEGAKRPGHFDGVVTILTKLFDWVQPDIVFFGQKDYQQCLVVKTLIKRKFQAIQFVACPIIRESDGLAMSSRNIRLSAEERAQAPRIYKALENLKQNWNAGNWNQALVQLRQELDQTPFELEYLEVCDPETLEPLMEFSRDAIALIALQLGHTRLIDNHIL